MLANIVPNEMWLETMLHELGHSVYSSKNIPRSVPYALRCESHILTTEGVAIMYGRFADNPWWLQAMGVKLPDPERFRRVAAQRRRSQLLIFSRWCQVMFRFEMALYDNPDQDLNRLWWDLVEKYQELRRPEGRDEPDYASKIHIVTAPVYYHNYMMGEMFASQVHHAIARDVLRGAEPTTAVYVGNKAAGAIHAGAGVHAGRHDGLAAIDPLRHWRRPQSQGDGRGFQQAVTSWESKECVLPLSRRDPRCQRSRCSAIPPGCTPSSSPRCGSGSPSTA